MLGCHGNQDIPTSHIDRLAVEGTRFTKAFAQSCLFIQSGDLVDRFEALAACRANWLGTESPDAQMGPEAYCAIDEFASLPPILGEAGNDCEVSGKWHVGDGPQAFFECHSDPQYDLWRQVRSQAGVILKGSAGLRRPANHRYAPCLTIETDDDRPIPMRQRRILCREA